MAKKVATKKTALQRLRRPKFPKSFQHLDIGLTKVLLESLVKQSKETEFGKLVDLIRVDAICELADYGQKVSKTVNKEARLLAVQMVRDIVNRVDRHLNYFP